MIDTLQATLSSRADYAPITVRTQSTYSLVPPVAFDCVKIIIIRSGRSRLFSEFGCIHVNLGDVVVLAANTLCGAEPEGRVTTTTLYLDRDYVVDQVFWQHVAAFEDRLDAGKYLDAHYAEPTQVVRLGEERAGVLMPWLNELAALSMKGLASEHFYRVQSLLSAVLDVVVPNLEATGQRKTSTQRSTVNPAMPRHRAFQPLRPEARKAAELLRHDLDRRWLVSELADLVHLSPSQLRRVFVDAFGKSPIAYLTMLRAERMAQLLRESNSPIAVIAKAVGWSDPGFASRQFRRSVGVSPSEYRRISHKAPLPIYPD